MHMLWHLQMLHAFYSGIYMPCIIALKPFGVMCFDYSKKKQPMLKANPGKGKCKYVCALVCWQNGMEHTWILSSLGGNFHLLFPFRCNTKYVIHMDNNIYFSIKFPNHIIIQYM